MIPTADHCERPSTTYPSLGIRRGRSADKRLGCILKSQVSNHNIASEWTLFAIRQIPSLLHCEQLPDRQISNERVAERLNEVHEELNLRDQSGLMDPLIGAMNS